MADYASKANTKIQQAETPFRPCKAGLLELLMALEAAALSLQHAQVANGEGFLKLQSARNPKRLKSSGGDSK